VAARILLLQVSVHLAAARAFTDGLPFLANLDGTCVVEIFELLAM
jgi:hypothetical protein